MRSNVTSAKRSPSVEAVEVDLEHAADMRLVVRMVVERHIIDLDRPVVARRIGMRDTQGTAISTATTTPAVTAAPPASSWRRICSPSPLRRVRVPPETPER